MCVKGLINEKLKNGVMTGQRIVVSGPEHPERWGLTKV